MPSYLRENITKRKDNENKGEQIRERGWYEKGNGNNVNMENIKERFTENAPIQECGKQFIVFITNYRILNYLIIQTLFSI